MGLLGAEPRTWLAKACYIVFGILLPSVALGVELFLGECAESYLDPIPTPWHVLLVSLVPIGCALFFFSPGDVKLRWYKPLAFLAGMMGVVAIFYSLLFLPMAPIAVIGILAAGIGLLPLSPALSLLAILPLVRKFCREVKPRVAGTQRRIWMGMACACLIFFFARGGLDHHQLRSTEGLFAPGGKARGGGVLPAQARERRGHALQLLRRSRVARIRLGSSTQSGGRPDAWDQDAHQVAQGRARPITA